MAQRGSGTEFQSRDRPGRSAALEARRPVDRGRDLTRQLVDPGLNVVDRIAVDPAQKPIPGSRSLCRRVTQDGAKLLRRRGKERRVRRHGDREHDRVLCFPRGRLLARGLEAGAIAADDEAIDIVDDRDEERVLFEDGLQGRSAEADDSGETAGFPRGGIHHRRPTLRQAQHSRPLEGAGASPGREFANAVARDYGARRPIRA